MKPLASVGRADLYAMDIVEFLQGCEGTPFDVTITSPPYNLGKAYEGVSDSVARAEYFDWVEYWGRLLYERTTEHGRFCVNVPLDVNLGGHFLFASDMYVALLSCGWEFQTTIVWDKGIGSSGTAYGSWMSPNCPNVMMPVELVLVFNREGWNRQRPKGPTDLTKQAFLEWRTLVWRFVGERRAKDGHPAPYPLELPKRLIQLFSFEDDLIFDPFVGSGTTCVAAELLGRDSIGVDQSESYLTELAVPRIARAIDEREGTLTDSQGTRWANLTLADAVS